MEYQVMFYFFLILYFVLLHFVFYAVEELSHLWLSFWIEQVCFSFSVLSDPAPSLSKWPVAWHMVLQVPRASERGHLNELKPFEIVLTEVKWTDSGRLFHSWKFEL